METTGMIREEWSSFLRRIADPGLDALERGELKRSMPVETTTEEDRSLCSHMEAFGRLITGIAPWVELSGDSSSEGGVRSEYAEKVRRAIGFPVDKN